MDLFEYQGKQYFARFDIPVSAGGVAVTVDEAVKVAEKAGYPVVVKAQVQVGGRGKAGGIKLANNADEVRTHAGNILGMDIKGHLVKRIWVENASDIKEEYYASFTLDRAAKKHLLMLSAQGGVDIEEVAAKDPDAIVKLHVNPVDGLSADVAKKAAVDAKIPAGALDGSQLGKCTHLTQRSVLIATLITVTPSGKSSRQRSNWMPARSWHVTRDCNTSVLTELSGLSLTELVLQ
jgi:succinyl-CoA synthetase beta subunit